MNKNKYLRCIHRCGVVTLLVLAGCATLDEPLRGNLSAEPTAVRACAEHFKVLNAAVIRAGVRDAEAYRVPGFPYLRVDRFSASLRAAAAGDDKASAQWIARLRALDHEARRVEISNLPEHEINVLAGGGRAALIDHTARCAAVLRDHDVAAPELKRLLRERALVPDDYGTVQRVAGVYALTRVPFFRGIVQWQTAVQQAFRDAAAGAAPAQPLMRYAYADTPAVTREQIAAIMRRASDNALRIPHYSDAEGALLLRAFAPVFDIESGGADDRIGRLRWTSDATLALDASAPVVYQRIAFTRYGERTLTQLVYTIWFAQRPPDHAFDLLAGQLDGVVLRVTLDTDGAPLLYDSIHPCGCYHQFFPTARVAVVPAPDNTQEWAFVPATLPAHTVGTRVTVRVATRTHYIVKVALESVADAASAITYTLAPEDELRTLPLPHDVPHTRSAYAPDGLVPGTERGERFWFWPMGIPSAGAMRQWGHHATAFVGRRHFDDADLIEKRFRVIAP